MINISGAYYHNLVAFDWIDVDKIFLERLESILSCGYILSREHQLLQLGIKNEKCFSNWNEDHYISLCKYNEKDLGSMSDAFTFFCRFGRSIVIREDLEDFCEKRIDGSYQKMDNEYQFKDRISIEHFLAIAVAFNHESYLKYIKRKIDECATKDHLLSELSWIFEESEQIRQLLRKYDMPIPIIGIGNGEIVPSLEEERKRILN